ncbi:MAG: hypothetical protein KDN22_31500, partial [Verrucomicrobiae bacterium]|nr:hypothetical protein [Verrucomicrobiae bacterium]
MPTHLTARTKADVIGYINRISAGTLNGSTLTGNGLNVNFYVDDYSDHPDVSGSPLPLLASDYESLQQAGINSTLLKFRSRTNPLPPMDALSNAAGYISHGGAYNSFIGSNGIAAGKVKFSNSSWYIMSTRESYNNVVELRI